MMPLVPRFGDKADLTKSLARLARDPALRKRLSHELRRRAAEDLSWSAGVRRFSSIHARLAGLPG